MGITFKGTATCGYCKEAREITLSVHKTVVNSNGVIGPGYSATVVGTVSAHLPDGWIQSDFFGTFCSEKCEDDHSEAAWGEGNRPNEQRRERERQEAATRERRMAALRKAITEEDQEAIRKSFEAAHRPFAPRGR